MAEYVLATGLDIPSVDDLINSFATQQKTDISPLLNTDPDGLAGQINGIVASGIREVYEVADVVYHMFDPDAAEDAQLEIVSAITGTFRAGATKAKFAGARRLAVNLEPGATLPIGAMAHVTGQPSNRWLATETVTNSGGVAASFFVAFEAETAGRRTANEFTVTSITTPVTGWNFVTNPTKPIPGTEIEDDFELRDRREAELRAMGSGTTYALAAELIALEYEGEKPIITAEVLENVTDVTDVYGLPPHSIEALIDDGEAAATPNDVIGQVIFDGKTPVYTHGALSGTAVDKYGANQTVRFSRVTYRYHELEVELTIDPTAYVGDASIKTHAIAASVLQRTGKRVRWSTFVDALKELGGVIAVTSVELRWAASSGTPFTDLIPGRRDRPRILNAAAITVTTVHESAE